MVKDFFFYFSLFNKNSRNEPGQTFFSISGHFESCQSIRHDLRRSHTSSLSTTQFHVNIGCHINLTGFITTFGIQTESRTPFDVTDFGSKSAKSDFLIIYYFSITKIK
jgi:hypothetical protein